MSVLKRIIIWGTLFLSWIPILEGSMDALLLFRTRVDFLVNEPVFFTW